MDTKGHTDNSRALPVRQKQADLSDFVLNKSIFSKVFEKDVRRVYIYKRCERIAKALHLISPAFKDAKAIRDRIQKAAVEIIDASSRPLAEAREGLSRELLTLASILSMAKASSMLSPMNAEVISREIHSLLHDVAAYEDQRIELPEVPTIAAISKSAPRMEAAVKDPSRTPKEKRAVSSKGHMSDMKDTSSRSDSVLSVLKDKGPSSIKDISTIIRNVSEKTIQRELQALVLEGKITKTGERRWTLYSLAG